MKPRGSDRCGVRFPRRVEAADFLGPDVLVEGEPLAGDAHVSHG